MWVVCHEKEEEWYETDTRNPTLAGLKGGGAVFSVSEQWEASEGL